MDALLKAAMSKKDAYWFLYRFMDVLISDRPDHKWTAELIKMIAIEEFTKLSKLHAIETQSESSLSQSKT